MGGGEIDKEPANGFHHFQASLSSLPSTTCSLHMLEEGVKQLQLYLHVRFFSHNYLLDFAKMDGN